MMENVNKEVSSVAVEVADCLNMSADTIIEIMNKRGYKQWGVDLDNDRVIIEVFEKMALTIRLNDKDFTISGDNTPIKGLSVLDDSVTLGDIKHVSSRIALALYALTSEPMWFN